jgi:hypothetical protein
MLKRLGEDGRVSIPAPAAAAGQLMGMIEHLALAAPLLSDVPVPSPNELEPACAEAVATFLARFGARAEAA